MSLALTLTKWLAPLMALLALACALLAPAEAGSPHARAQNVRSQADDAKPAVPDDSIVCGRAVYDDTTRPVRRARVLLITDGVSRNEYAGLTDARGDFCITNVRAGSYYAFVDVPGALSPVGFVSVEDMRAAPGSPSLGEGRKYFDPIEVDGKQEVKVTVHARRGASIAGRVSYADGDPAVNVAINLMRRGADGRVQKYLTGANIIALSGLRTDDRGMFRLTGLPPGEYLVGVNESINHGSEGIRGGVGDDVSGMFRGMFTQQLLMTFYPSATNMKEAGAIKVEAGEERSGVDITIPERDLRTINGVVRARRGGRPAARARITIARRDDPLAPSGPMAAYYEVYEGGSNSTTTDEEGRWQFKEIPDGSYVINVKPPEEYESAPADVSANASSLNSNAAPYRQRRKRSYAPTHRDLEVSSDVSEFVVEVSDGARVTGTVTIEGGDEPRYGRVSLMRLGEGGALFGDMEGGFSGIEGGRFTVEGLPAGKFMLQPSVGGGSAETYLKSITWNGKDLRREPLELAEGASIEGVHIVYARNPATLHVTVRAAAGKQVPPELFIALVPVDLSAWSPSTMPHFCTTGETGTCPISAPPGEYHVIAMRRPSSPAAYEQEVKRRALAAPRVTLREGETRRVEVEAPDN